MSFGFHIKPIIFKTRFHKKKKKIKKNVFRENLVGRVPSWVNNIHFDLGMAFICVPTHADERHKDIKDGVLYRVKVVGISDGRGVLKVEILD